MISEVIKKKIEEKSGIRLRYSKDCELLSEKIFAECRFKLSASTLRRLLGFTKSNFNPRTHSLDVIANYLGYPDFEALIESFDTEGAKKSKMITELKPNNLRQGERYIYTYKPNVEVTIEYIGRSWFKVLTAKNSKLQPGDSFKVSVLTLHHPLFLLEVEREGESLGKIIEAKVSGITHIKKV